MDGDERLGFSRGDLRARYDVDRLIEDEWHQFSDGVTATTIAKYLYPYLGSESWVLNAGAGVHDLALPNGRELSFDLFTTPIAARPFAVCGSVEALPFRQHVFSAIVCVGEVIAYCDPARVFSEFARVIQPGGTLIVDFGSTRSARLAGTRFYGRSAVLLSSEYNGSDEKTWIYDPDFISNRLSSFGFVICKAIGIHAWSSIARRLGLTTRTAIGLQRTMGRYTTLARYADTVTVVAEAAKVSKPRR